MSHSPPRYALLADIQAVQSVEFIDRGVARHVAEQALAETRIPGLVRRLLLNPRRPFPARIRGDLHSSTLLRWGSATEFAAAAAGGPVAYHIMCPVDAAPLSELYPAFARESGIPLVTSLYDLVPLVMPREYFDGAVPRPFEHRMGLFRESQLVLANSRSAARDAERLLGVHPDRIAVVGAGVSQYFTPGDPDAAAASLRERFPALIRPYVLSVTGSDARKNTECLIDAFAALPRAARADLQLVLCCGVAEDVAQAWQQHAIARGLQPGDVVLTGSVSDDILRNLYRGARVSILASLYEGFGLPVVESLACGTAVLCSNTSSLPEVLDDARALFDPRSVSDIAAHLERALGDAGLRRSLVDTGRRRLAQHTWERVALRVSEAMQRLPAPRAHRPRGRRLRIALGGPQPPTLSGIADYNSRLAESLRDRCDLHLLYTGGAAPPGGEVPAFPIAALGLALNPHDYDAVVYTLGNSEHHFDTYEVAMRHSGVLWLHDARVPMFYLMHEVLRSRTSGRTWLQQMLRDMYGDRIPAAALQHFGREEQWRYGLGCTRQWVGNARAVLVNSAFAERLVRIDQGPDAPVPPVHRMPFAVNPLRPVQQTVEAREDDQRPVVATFGFVDPVKGTTLLLDAMRHVRRAVDARLVFVGHVDDAQRLRLTGQAESLGIADAVEMTGSVSVEAWNSWLQRATVAVQLRTSTNGEMSAAVSDCIGAGLPVISNMLGAAAEYPDRVVHVVDSDVTDAELAGDILALLRDDSMRAAARSAAVAHSQTHTYDRLATELLEVCAGLQDASR